MFRTQHHKENQPPVEELLMDGWSPNGTNGISNGGWGRSDEHKDINGPEICWDHSGSVQPLGLIPMSDEEKEVRNIRRPL